METLNQETIRTIENALYARLEETRAKRGEASQFTKVAQAQWEMVVEIEKFVEGKAPQFAKRYGLA